MVRLHVAPLASSAWSAHLCEVGLVIVPMVGAAVVIVSGLPGAGKSTLARRLGADLAFVVVCRDQLQAIFTEVRGVLAETERHGLLGAAGNALVTHIARAVLDAGQGAVIDNNFNWHWQINTVRAFLEARSPRAFEVRLWGDAAVLRRRWAEREPHLAGLSEMQPILDAAYAKPREYVLGEEHPRLELETTDPAHLDAAYPELLGQIRQYLGRPERVS